MAESTVGDVTDSESDQFTSRPPSPNIEEQSLLSELKGEFVDNSLFLRSFMSSRAIRSRPFSHLPFWLIKW